MAAITTDGGSPSHRARVVGSGVTLVTGGARPPVNRVGSDLHLRRDAAPSVSGLSMPAVAPGRRLRVPDTLPAGNNALVSSATGSVQNLAHTNGSVRVVVRCRPMNATETGRGDRHLFRFASKELNEMQVVSCSGHGRELVRSFQFDLCASEELSQGVFFRSCGVTSLLDSVVDGYLATVFAYGQTGSGKTYSMSGIEELLAVAHKRSLDTAPQMRATEVELSDGIIPRALKYLYALIERAPSEVSFVVRASYCEIYNEQAYDLLNPTSGSLSIRWNDRRGFYVQDLLVVQCDGVDDLMAVVHEGHRNRRVGTHEMNKDSSRSHSLMTIHVDRVTTDPNDGHVVTKFGKISFVDLAGSERLKETKSSNAEETCNINKSLLTLGKVISALASKASAAFIPYRDSKLTKLLMDSLGGNSLTLMIACVSPSSVFLEDTLSTLNYATRAKNIQNKPTVQVDPTEFALSNLRKENAALRAENEALRMRVRSLAASGRGGASANNSDDFERRSTRLLPPLVNEPSSQQLTRISPVRGDHKFIATGSSSMASSPTNRLRTDDAGNGSQIAGVGEATKNQMIHLQEENDRLGKHVATTEKQLRQLRLENDALRAKTTSAFSSSTARFSPTKPTPSAASSDETTQKLQAQVQQLQRREQELMQALSRRSRGQH